jgi:hypothetical protein
MIDKPTIAMIRKVIRLLEQQREDLDRQIGFGMVDRTKASELYNAWLLEHLKGSPHRSLRETNGYPCR